MLLTFLTIYTKPYILTNFVCSLTDSFFTQYLGEDEQSMQLLANWEEENVSKAATNCVAIKVDAKRYIFLIVCIDLHTLFFAVSMSMSSARF